MTTPKDPPPTNPPTSPEFLSAVVDRLAHPVFVKDQRFRFVFVNDAFAQLAGVPRDAMLGRTDYDFFPVGEADLSRRKDEETIETRQTVEVSEESITDASGIVHILSTTKAPLTDASGAVTHVVGIIHDITRLKQQEEALRSGKEELEARVQERTAELKRAQRALLHKERLSVLGQLAAGLAHQLRNPLASITNAASVIERRVRSLDHGDAAVAISIIKEEVQAANQIITDLLEYARVRPPIPQEIVLRDLVDSVLDAHPVPTGVAVTRRIPLELVPVVDGDQLRSALRNLVRNAFEAMPRGGKLMIDAGQDDTHFWIRVTDTGEGIPAALRPQVFDPLVSSKPLGLGLGLTTARTLVENQAGTLKCRDTPGAGAVFEIRVPLEPPPTSSYSTE